MLKLDRYLLGDFVQSFLATLIVLLVVSVGGVLVDILGNIADGRLPAKLLFSQLGLQFIAYLPLILPLALMLGLLLAIARLYRDSEMAVITAIGVGPKRLLRPLLMLVVPVVLLVGACSLWLGPWAGRVAEQMIIEANRSVLMAGLEPGRFTRCPMAAWSTCPRSRPMAPSWARCSCSGRRTTAWKWCRPTAAACSSRAPASASWSWMMATRWKARWPGRWITGWRPSPATTWPCPTVRRPAPRMTRN
jgi:hypothetical protein